MSALLRLQSRRLDNDEAKTALEQSVRRISAIAMVHESLALDTSLVVDFDTIVTPLVRSIEEGIGHPERPLRIDVEGTFGEISGEVAMPMAVVLTELVQNALDHAGPAGGSVTASFSRSTDHLHMQICDSGPGVPDGFSLDRDAGLGLTIVRTFVVRDLGGTISIRPRADKAPRGTIVDVSVPRRAVAV